MLLIAAIVLLSLLKYLEVWKFAAMSWWWVIGLAIFSFVWFEFIEKMLGLDKKSKANDENEQRRKARVADNFKKK